MYHLNEVGLENIYLVNGFVFIKEEGEEFVSFIHFQLERSLGV